MAGPEGGKHHFFAAFVRGGDGDFAAVNDVEIISFFAQPEDRLIGRVGPFLQQQGQLGPLRGSELGEDRNVCQDIVSHVGASPVFLACATRKFGSAARKIVNSFSKSAALDLYEEPERPIGYNIYRLRRR